MAEHDPSEFWDEMWDAVNEAPSDSDEILASQVQGLPVGRALDLGCGTGGNALWLAARGWDVTAVDFSAVAIERARSAATERGLSVRFEVADAASYIPDGAYDLITSFYIHLPPEQRAEMFAHSMDALAPGGTLLFVSHDRSTPPPGWSDEDRRSLTTPEQVVAELAGLEIEQAFVLASATASGAHAHSSEPAHEHAGTAPAEHGTPGATVVRATRPRGAA